MPDREDSVITALARRIDRARALARTDPVAAVAALDGLRRDHPGNPRAAQALRDLARHRLDTLLPEAAARARSGDWGGALDTLCPLAAADPGNAGLVALTAEGLIATARFRAAIALLDRARRRHPDDATLAGLTGAALRAAGDSKAALVPLRHALARDPGHAAAGNSYGLALLDLGDRAGAVAAWRKVVAANPRAADTWMNLAPLADFAAEPDLKAALEAAAASGGLSPAERECLTFARAEAALQTEGGDSAFGLLHRANAARRRAIGYSPARDRQLFDLIRDRFGALSAPASTRATGGPRPILITGLPRSGTTLTEQILAAHPEVHAGGELDALTHALRPHLAPEPTPDPLPALADAYRTSLAALTDAAILTDKMPLNFRWIGPVLAALPEARVIHLTRDPMAVGLSLYRHRFSGTGNGFAYDLADIGAFTRMERDLMAFWRTRWGPDRLLDLEYAALTANPEPQIRRLLEFCGLRFHPACLSPETADRAVQTASAAQVRRPIYTGSTEKWRRWSAQLAPLAAALTDPDASGSPPVAPG